ncbi:MAG: N-acetylmuramoyl-L-alanine amidase [Clostridiales bacterium]|nr:N-acetylmuramoyl-L-alanine amidase [Clostridiales bacterium]
MNKKIRTILITAVLLLAFSVNAFGGRYVTYTLNYDGSSHSYNAEEVILKVEGETLTNLTMPPIIMNGYTLVPAREVFEKMGVAVSWNSEREEVYISEGSNLLVLKINSETAFYNEKEVSLSAPAKLINSKTMIPVRFVSETLGYGVNWNETERTVSISKDSSQSVTEPTTASAVTTTTAAAEPETTAAPSADEFTLITIGTDTAGLPDELYDLTDASHYDANITGISQASDKTYIKISADNEISKVVKGIYYSGVYYFDIYAAKSSQGNVKMAADVGGISEIRVGQRTEDSYNIVRIAMDTTDTDFTVNMTADRKAIYIFYPEPEISDYKLKSNESADIFTVTGHDLVKPTVSENGETITVTFKNTELSAAEQTLKRSTTLYVSKAAIAAEGDDAVITFTLKEEASCSAVSTGTTVTLTIAPSSYTGLTADSSTDTITLTKKNSSISISDITEEDDYRNHKYTITLPGNFSSDYGSGEYIFENSERLNSMTVKISGGNTVLTFDEKVISAFTITEDKSNIYINCVDIHDKYDKIVVLDAGHGGSDSGAIGNGLYEKDLNLDIILKIRDLIEADGTIKAYLTREDDTFISLQYRSDFGNEVDCPFVSVHINSAGTSTSANGLEVYWQYENTDENGLTSYELASAVYDKLIEYLDPVERGVKTSNLHVLREADNPSTLIEIGFISNAAEAAKMGTESYRALAAQAIFDALTEVL